MAVEGPEGAKCVICDQDPHDALRLICSNNACNAYVCGTTEKRRCCVGELSRGLPFGFWNQSRQRLEFGACRRGGCAGVLLGTVFEEAQRHLKETWNLSRRACDWFYLSQQRVLDPFGNRVRCAYVGNHQEIDDHVLQHIDPGVGNLNHFSQPVTDMDSDYTDNNVQGGGDDEDEEVQGFPIHHYATDDDDDFED